jgi:release factor glutamine methyltransferase
MTTIAALLAAAAKQLATLSDSPRLDAEVLLAWTLGLSRTELTQHSDAQVNAHVEDFFARLLALRHRRVPVAYLTGQKAFLDFDVDVTPHTLIPRPFTETLVMALIDDLGQAPRVVADIGTGSGAIALAVARHAPQARVIGTDVSVPALRVAAANARRLGLLRQIDWRAGSLLEPLRPEDRVDTLIANLPYVPDHDLLEPSLRFEPATALAGGQDGLRLLTSLFHQLKHYPSVSVLMVEILPSQVDHVAHDFRSLGFTIEAISDGQQHRGLIGRR